MKFSERLQNLRKTAGLTQSGLSKAAGVPLGTLRNLEQGHREPTWPTLRRLSLALGVSLGAWDGLEDEDPRPVRKSKAKR